MEERRVDELPDKAEGQDKTGGLWLIWVFVFLIVYVLSVGPVARLYSGKTPPRALLAFYAPLEFAYYHLPPAKEFIDWYRVLRSEVDRAQI